MKTAALPAPKRTTSPLPSAVDLQRPQALDRPSLMHAAYDEDQLRNSQVLS
jgi:hypothetical protein